MKNISILFLLVLTLAVFQKTTAQSCLPDGITFFTQTQIDSFQINYPGCTQILGSVTISDNTFGDLTNLNGLSPITSIGGYLTVWNNDTLTSLSGLDNMTSIEGYLAVGNNDALTSLSGLDNVTSVVGALFVENNDALTSLSGLDNVTSFGGILQVYQNNALTSLSGLDNVTSIEGDLFVVDNDALTSLSGLDDLTSIMGDLIVNNNDALTSLSGLDNVTSVGAFLVVVNNVALTSLSSLDNIDYSTITELTITYCPNLSMCEVNSICDYLENGGIATVSGNATGCNNVSEIEAACLVPMEEILSDGKVIIQTFPNPTSGVIQIDGNNLKDLEFNIWNTTGTLLENHQHIENGQIDLSHLPSGLYFLEIRNKDQIVVEKIIKE